MWNDNEVYTIFNLAVQTRVDYCRKFEGMRAGKGVAASLEESIGLGLYLRQYDLGYEEYSGRWTLPRYISRDCNPCLFLLFALALLLNSA
jgi:hypothetical protein